MRAGMPPRQATLRKVCVCEQKSGAMAHKNFFAMLLSSGRIRLSGIRQRSGAGTCHNCTLVERLTRRNCHKGTTFMATPGDSNGRINTQLTALNGFNSGAAGALGGLVRSPRKRPGIGCLQAPSVSSRNKNFKSHKLRLHPTLAK